MSVKKSKKLGETNVERNQNISENKIEIYKRFSSRKNISNSLKSIGINKLNIYGWPKEINIDTNYEKVPACLRKLKEFEEWAEKANIDLSPHFKRKEYEYFTGEKNKVVVFPEISIAIYDEDELIGVFPCTKKDDSYTIIDFLSIFKEKKSSLEKSEKLYEITKLK